MRGGALQAGAAAPGRAGWIAVIFAWSLPCSLFGMQAAVVAAAALGLGWTLWRRSAQPWRSRLERPLLLLLAAIGLSLLLAPRPPASFRAVTSFWVLAALPLTVWLLADRRHLRLALAGLLLIACAAAGLGLVQAASGWTPWPDVLHPGMGPLLEPAPGRPGWFAAVGLFHSRLTFAHVLLFPLAWAAALLLQPLALRWRLLAAAAAVLLAAGIAVSFTRAAPVAGAAVVVGLIVARLRRGWPRWLAVALLAAAALAALLAAPAVGGRLARSFAGKKDWGRLAIWHSALDLGARQPLSGVGYGAFQRAAAGPIDQRRRQVGADDFPGTLAWAHNNLLTFWAECGALGVLAFVWLFVAWARAGLGALARARGDPLLQGFVRGSLAAVAAFLLVGLFHDTFFDGEVVFCLHFTLGATLAVGRWAGPAPPAPAPSAEAGHG